LIHESFIVFFYLKNMICGICKKTLLISEGIAEMNSKKYHMSCKLDFEKDWRKQHGLRES